MVDSTPKLFAYKNSNNLLKLLVAAKAANYKMEVVEVENNIAPKLSVEDSPTNTYPYLKTSSGIISEASAILNFIGAQGGLSGSNDFERAQVSQWQYYATHEILGNKRYTIYPIFGFVQFDDKENKEQTDKMKHNLKTLNTHLADKQYLLGSVFTIADIDLWSQLKHFWQLVYVEAVRTKLFGNIDAWFARVSNHPAVLSVYGITHVAKVAQKSVKVEKPKEEKKAEKPKEDVKEEKKPEKKENKFPETTMDFDKFKKDFSNTTEKIAVLDNFFKAEYDRNAFSIYYTRYQKLKSEGLELWKTENKRDFFLQKIDSCRKHAFAHIGIYGVEGDYEIKGVWLWQGKGIPFFMEEHESFEFYDRKELNPDVEADRKLINDYWTVCKEGEVVESLPVVNVVSFK